MSFKQLLCSIQTTLSRKRFYILFLLWHRNLSDIIWLALTRLVHFAEYVIVSLVSVGLPPPIKGIFGSFYHNFHYVTRIGIHNVANFIRPSYQISLLLRTNTSSCLFAYSSVNIFRSNLLISMHVMCKDAKIHIKYSTLKFIVDKRLSWAMAIDWHNLFMSRRVHRDMFHYTDIIPKWFLILSRFSGWKQQSSLFGVICVRNQNVAL